MIGQLPLPKCLSMAEKGSNGVAFLPFNSFVFDFSLLTFPVFFIYHGSQNREGVLVASSRSVKAYL